MRDEDGNQDTGQSTFVVVLHAEAAARFLPEDYLHLTKVPGAHGLVDVIYRTDYVDEGQSSPVPRSLWAEIAGPAPTIDDALNDLGLIGASLGATIAVAANAYGGDLRPHLAFDATDGLKERAFFQRFVRRDQAIPVVGRVILRDAAGHLIEAVSLSPHRKRLNRAIAQYAIALGHWNPMHEILALAHLYMGMETMTKVAVRVEAAREGCDEDELQRRLGLENGHELEIHVRRTVLFDGDEGLYRAARRASDEFEHGLADFDVIRGRASAARDKTAELLRKAIISSSGLAKPWTEALLAPPYDRPKPWFGYERYLRGEIISESPTRGTPEALARADKQYPMTEISQRLTRFDSTDHFRYELDIETNVTSLLADGLSLKLTGLEMYAPENDTYPEASPEGSDQSGAVEDAPDD